MFNSYEELMQAVNERRIDTLTLEVDLGGAYSPEHEEAKKALQTAKAMQLMAGAAFLGNNLDALEAKVEETRPEPHSVWIRYKRLDLAAWAVLTKSAAQLTPLEQYEKVLPETFVGVWGQEPEEGVEPLSTDGSLLSSKGNNGILPGGALHSVVQTFMSWQNSGGEVSIRPTKSGQD